MTDIYLTKTFQAFAAHERISDATVIKAAREIQNHLYEANLGSCVYKKRVARAGGGKRGGYRVLIAFRDEDRLFFMRGFAKNEKDTVANDELVGLKRLAALYLDYSPFRLYQLVNDRKLRRLTYEQNPC
ncbi:type II toxin-antitoxin system RelE/ParE family toxin [Serratia liquefaciens]|uniref:type II toxin-antitoxin system RelE/ParE family toxin n=1 Tax=Serratia liquefaciens TaxID=614 RepID=UPI0022DD8D8E|nr:type II toxin-antitoxin system RelE/ParE family toxin [Serratia liquefaciens]WBL73491.1 type II toxin-antitoxin system RelE/ParE family toxin [Serratia liquefaciens]